MKILVLIAILLLVLSCSGQTNEEEQNKETGATETEQNTGTGTTETEENTGTGTTETEENTGTGTTETETNTGTGSNETEENTSTSSTETEENTSTSSTEEEQNTGTSEEQENTSTSEEEQNTETNSGACTLNYTINDQLDTCDRIAYDWSISTQQLSNLNPNLDCNNLQVNQILCVATESIEVEVEQYYSGEELFLSSEVAESEQISPELRVFIEQVITAHQYFRKQYGCPQLTWNFTLNASATKWATYLAENDIFQHTTDFSYGENLAGSDGILYPPEWYINTWGDEGRYYVAGATIFNDAASTTGSLDAIGHWSQVVWRSAISVGCGLVTSSQTSPTVARMVCQYHPTGNNVGEAML